MPLSIGVNLRVTGHCNQGGRKYMEDMFSVAYQQTSDDKDLEYAFFGIFDGHGGGEAATFAKEHLMDIIVKQKNFWSDKDEDVLRAIRDGYVNTHYAMWRELDKWPRTASGLPSTAGTTASIAFIRKGKIYIGHVGDSGIVLGYQDDHDLHWKAKALTKDHKPESEPEMIRIQESGGKVVSKSGVPRVVWNRPRIGHKGPVRRSTHIDEIPFLAVARSLGDLWSYNSELDTFVVSPEPDVKVVAVDVKSHRCLIFGTDGLWNMLTPKSAVSIVQAAERHNEKHLIASQQTGHGADVQMWINPSKSLVDHALERWFSIGSRADNTSVVTLMLDPPGPSRSEVLLSQKKEHVPMSKGTTVRSVFCASNAVSTETAEKPAPCSVSPFPSKSPGPLISPKLVSTETKQPDSSIGTDDGTTTTRSNVTEVQNSSHQDKDSSMSHSNENRESNESPEEGLSGNVESIQVAEISSSDTCVQEVKAHVEEESKSRQPTSVDKGDETTKEVGGSTTDGDSKHRESGRSLQILVQQVVPSKSFSIDKTREESNVLSNVVRRNAFSGTCEELKKTTVILGNRLRRDGKTVTADGGSALSRCRDDLRNGIITSGTKHSHGSLSRAENSLIVDACVDVRSRRSRGTKRRHSVTVQIASVISNSSDSVEDKSRPPDTIAGCRVRHGVGAPTESSVEANDPITPTPVEASTNVESCMKRRTRSDDRPGNPTDENNPVSQESKEPPHNRLRWPVSEPSLTRTTVTTTSSSGTAAIGRERRPSPSSFQRRSLEKKATPVKTIRRPSINGSSRIQLRGGSFGLRDWEQVRPNRTVCISPTDSPPQRWLRSDTIAATPIKTLRSRNVDITGHTVSAQLASQYGIIKQNRVSLLTKSKQSAGLSTKMKSSLSTDRHRQAGGGGAGGVAVVANSGSGSGMAKRAKSPYNPSARSLSTRSRIKRLGK